MATISAIHKDFLAEIFPDVEILSIKEFVGDKNFNVTVANQGELNIVGIAILKFAVAEGQPLFEVPFLVTGDKLANTIIGYNTIEYLATNFREQLDIDSREIQNSGSFDESTTSNDIIRQGARQWNR